MSTSAGLSRTSSVSALNARPPDRDDPAAQRSQVLVQFFEQHALLPVIGHLDGGQDAERQRLFRAGANQRFHILRKARARRIPDRERGTPAMRRSEADAAPYLRDVAPTASPQPRDLIHERESASRASRGGVFGPARPTGCPSRSADCPVRTKGVVELFDHFGRSGESTPTITRSGFMKSRPPRLPSETRGSSRRETASWSARAICARTFSAVPTGTVLFVTTTFAHSCCLPIVVATARSAADRGSRPRRVACPRR